MAIIQYSGLVSHISGSISGSTFQKSSAGAIVRKKPLPVGRGTNSQNAQRVIISQLNYYWNNLTVAERTQWSAFAVYTNGVNKTNKQKGATNNGKTQFFAVNAWLLLYGKPVITAPTIIQPVQVNPPYVVNGNQSNDLGRLTNALDTSSQILVYQISLPQSVGTNTSNTGFRTLVFPQVDGTVQAPEAAYINQFGIALQKGSRYWVQTRIVNFITGAISPAAKALILYTDIASGGIGYMIIGSTNIVG